MKTYEGGTPGERVVDVLDKIVVNNLLPASGWREVFGKFLEASQVLAKLDVWNIHDDVEQGNGGTSVAGSLVCEPHMIWAGALLLDEVILDIAEEEDETMYGLPGAEMSRWKVNHVQGYSREHGQQCFVQTKDFLDLDAPHPKLLYHDVEEGLVSISRGEAETVLYVRGHFRFRRILAICVCLPR